MQSVEIKRARGGFRQRLWRVIAAGAALGFVGAFVARKTEPPGQKPSAPPSALADGLRTGPASADLSPPARATAAATVIGPIATAELPGAASAATAATPDELSALAASLVVPVAGVTPEELRSSFDEPRGDGTRRHNALDIPAPRGTPVISATAGRVLRLYTSKAGGLMIYAADATERFILMYGHLDRYAPGLRDGMRLERGQTIGYVGTTGNAPPGVPHLHFAIARSNDVRRWSKGTPVDPAPLLRR